MSHAHVQDAVQLPPRLSPYEDARTIVRMLQCSQCSLPLRTPVTLPCGNSICKQCLPSAHHREHITYPALPSRQMGITCPFPDCAQVHPLDDFSVDVVLLKILETMAAEITKSQEATTNKLVVELVPDVEDTPDSPVEKAPSETLKGGRLASTYSFAHLGKLHYVADVTWRPESEEDKSLDKDLFSTLQTTVYDKVECQVCYNMLLDPITTVCGHSFCRKCVARVLDHSTLCPHCRRTLGLTPGLEGHASNLIINKVVDTFWRDELLARIQAVKLEETEIPGGLNTALFVCTVAFPSMPMILHVFEPRYRLMVRRAMEGNRQFGMVTYNESRQPQGEMGVTQFNEVGTMLYIEQCQMEGDGRSWLLCRGVYRFKVLAHGALDGYTIGRVQRLNDVPLAEEEEQEAQQLNSDRSEQPDYNEELQHMTTTDMVSRSLQFLERAQAQSGSRIQNSVEHIYGPPPNDAILLPYWFASVVPLPDHEKYKLLPTTSVRERLKITMRWIRKIEAQRW